MAYIQGAYKRLLISGGIYPGDLYTGAYIWGAYNWVLIPGAIYPRGL